MNSSNFETTLPSQSRDSADVRSDTNERKNNVSSESTPFELELELIQTQMAQKPMLRAEVGMRVRCANKASAE